MVEALLGVVFENLMSLAQNEFATISGIKSKAQDLSTTLDLIKVVLDDAEQKQVTDRSIKEWLKQLKDAVYLLDDILDECSIKSKQFRGSSYFNPKNIMFLHEIGNRFKNITRRFDQIAESKNKFLLQEGLTLRERSIEVPEWRQTSSTIAEPKVYGREEDKEKIMEFLFTKARDSDILSIYPIVGLGGVGKTTLAQLVYNDDQVSSYFNSKIWVCVSEAFSVKRILSSIVESITREKCHVLDLDVIERKVHELLQGKRYLLVLDDVWNRCRELEFGLSQEKWNKLKSVFSCGSKGSSILVSTRDNDVAAIMGTCQAHHLSGLSENECWLLFKQYAFGHDREEREELTTIGKDIIKKCGGLPLTAQALGGLMRSRRDENEWHEIKDSELWILPYENSILPALRLSYFHLTPTSKQCFAFCAIFPKDVEIMKEDLIHLWMTNGFISSRINLEVEHVGNMIWNELCQKSFFQDIKIDYKGDVYFKMHDLMHDLAQSVAAAECIILDNAGTNLSKNTHHIGFGSATSSSFDKDAFEKVESLRTLYQLDFFSLKDSAYFPTNCSLRVLRTSTLKLSSLKSLIHLRYLELNDFTIETLPNSIYCLQKLEILKLKNIGNLSCLPKHMILLQSLRHLVIEGCHSLSRMFPYIGRLCWLRTLSVYIVRLETGHTLAELCNLNLAGKLKIEGLKDAGNLVGAWKANLMGKKDLQELYLSWSNSDQFTETPTTTSAEQLLGVLQPHSNLKRLEINFYDGLYFPSWLGLLNNLVDLKLVGCDNCLQLPPLGKLPSLKKLKLQYMDNLQCMDDDEYNGGVEVMAFPSLEELFLDRLPNLEKLLKVKRGKMFLRLSNFTIFHCPKLDLPCLPCVKHLPAYGVTNALLRSISSFYGLTKLHLKGDVGMMITSFPEGMFKNLTCLETLTITDFPKLKELPNEPFSLALERLGIFYCSELESLPDQIWDYLRSLRTMEIGYCEGLQSLPKGIRHLTSLESLNIQGCPALKERYMKGTGEDWDKIAHIPKVHIR